ncbi:hypothetical protein CLH62_01795 [Marinobacter guineae]|uniref:Sulfotransferase n=1 Tax=Marinobacter guineae TaxID=432303 RepID=A0A2G1VHU5_9GAMM|nr:sulfotransferase [Marinobacter guineae]PHQ26356.1 hypothetical protein CLH62_01795 [Marinobacter guineae]
MKKAERTSGPDFICIGAQKAGTTWLYDQLVHHPEIWLPVIKELHYFNFARPHPELAGIEEYPWGGSISRMRFLKERPSLETLLWLLRYNFKSKDAAWYRSLFPKDDFRIRGELTPAYSTLDEEGVRYVYESVPDHCRIFMILRDPVERAWSGLKMNYRWRNEKIGEDIESLRRAMLKPTNQIRSSYSNTVPTWERQFGDRFRLFFYQDLVNDPKSFLASILDFLQVDSNWQSPAIEEHSNADNNRVKIPEELYSSLATMIAEDVEFFNDRLLERS